VVAQLRFQAFEPPGKICRVGRYKEGMSNALRPDLMMPAERLDEVAEILAAGLMRLKLRKSSHLSAAPGESSLDCVGHQSSHAHRLKSDGGLD
jgi:hypothetical protein